MSRRNEGAWGQFSRLAWRPRARRVPYVQQLTFADCGAACLAMVLKMHGREIPVRQLSDEMGIGRGAVTGTMMLEAAKRHGMRGRGVRLDVDDLHLLPRGSILHWGFRHYVVFDRVRGSRVEIVDPASGRRRVPLTQFRRNFTGLAVVLEPADGFQTTKGGRSPVFNYLRQLLSHRDVLGRVVLLSMLLRVFALGVPLLTALVVDRVVPRADEHLLLVIVSGLGLVLVFRLLSRLVRAHLLLQLRTTLDAKLTLGFIEHMADLPYAFFQTRTSGDLMVRIASNAAIRQILTSGTLSALLDGIFATLYLILIFATHTTMGAIAAGLGAVQMLVFWLSRRRVADLTREALEVQSQSQGYLVQLLAGMETLKLSGAEQRAVEHWAHLFVNEINVGLATGRLSAAVNAIVEGLRGSSPLVLLAVGATAVMEGELSLGTMLAVNTLAAGFLSPLASLVNTALSVQQLGGHVERIDDVLSTAREQQAEREYKTPALRGAISLRDVGFAYEPGAPMVVRGVSLDIEPGTAIAIVGKSGSGKSTLAKLLLSIYEPTDGSIRYDGHDLRELDHRALRQQMGVVAQTPFVFGRSIRDNIALTKPDADLDAITRAAKLAEIHRDVERMPMGYETVLAEGGASMSGGERQRLALARALVHRPNVLLLDEATSALDNETERRVMENLAALDGVRIIIAHRLSTLSFADKIVVMHEGELVEHGTHRELMTQRGHYYNLVMAGGDGTSADAYRHG